MKLVDGIWLPDQEAHFPKWWSDPRNSERVDGKATYQYRKIREFLGWVTHWRNCVDAGAHCGTWAMHLVKRFEMVHAFEPVPQFRQCFEKNVTARNYILYACALGSVSGKVRMKIDPADTGGTHVDIAAESGDVALRTLDEFELQEVDAIKIDAEGYESQIVEGSRDTIRRCKPCIIVEQKERKLQENYGIRGAPAVELLKSWGYTVRKVISGDYILTR